MPSEKGDFIKRAAECAQIATASIRREEDGNVKASSPKPIDFQLACTAEELSANVPLMMIASYLQSIDNKLERLVNAAEFIAEH